MLGRPRDSYYRELSSINLRVGLRILTPLKKTFHRVNHLKVENSSDFQGAKGHTQTPFEVVTGMDIRTDFVCYRLYLSAASDSDTARTTMDEIERNLHMESGTYPLTLGTANFTAQVQGFRIFMENDWHERPAPMDFMSLHSAIFSERVLAIDTRSNSKLLAEEELLPADFVDNYNRELSGMHRLFFAIDGQPLPLKISGNYIELHNADEETENIVFLD